MLYGLYLSASGVVANSHRQDVISNNLANSETTGFKRDLAMFYQRRTEAETRGLATGGGASNRHTDPLLENIGGGIFASPTLVDAAQGGLEQTGNPLDVAIEGKGFFTVSDGTNTRLTRDGHFNLDREGNLILATSRAYRILDDQGQPIRLDPTHQTLIGEDGTIQQNGQTVAKIGMFDVPDARQLKKIGGQLLSIADTKTLTPSAATVHSQFLEQSNIDPSIELAALMDSQRQLEANANMIRYQDQMLQKLVNEVGKIG